VRRIGRPFLTEMAPQEFAEKHSFRMLSEDDVAINPDPAIRVDVESFTPTDTYRPDKPYLTRLTWPGASPDRDGRKLLLADPKSVFAVVYGKALSPAKTGKILQTVRFRRRETGARRHRRDSTTAEP
jgi:hypothetical protein